MKQHRFGRRAAIVGAAGALALSVAGCGSSGNSASGASSDKVLTRTIKVGAFPTLNGLDVQIAAKQGYFKAEGLNVQVVPVKSAAEALPQLQGGSVDIAETDMTTAILAKSKNFPFTAVAPGTVGVKPAPTDKISSGEIWCGADSPVKSLADLPGTKFAIPAVKSQVWLDVRSAVDEAGGDSSKIQFVETPDTPGAIKAGDVDCGTVAEPQGTSLLSDKEMRWLGPYATADGGLAYMFVAGTKLAQESPATLAAFQRAILKANATANANHALAVKVATATLTTWDASVLSKAAYPTWDEKPATAADVTKASDRIVKYGLVDKSDVPSPSDVIATQH